MDELKKKCVKEQDDVLRMEGNLFAKLRRDYEERLEEEKKESFCANLELEQAEKELADSPIRLMKMGNPDVPTIAGYIEENLPEKAVVLTGDHHNNPVAALTGRYIVCGTGSYLYYHGMDYSAQRNAMAAMLSDPANNLELFDEYNVDYIYISDAERWNFKADEAWFEENCSILYSEGNIDIFACDFSGQ